MARPLYIICSESGSVDRYTNTVSAYRILESIQVGRMHEHKIGDESFGNLPKSLMQVRMVATWISDEAEQGREFEYETTIQKSTDTEPQKVNAGTFVWTARNHRFLFDMMIGFASPDAGSIKIANSIRPKEAGAEWLKQEYEISVEPLKSPVSADSRS